MSEHDELVALTAKITAAHVSRNDVPTTELPNLISIVYQALATAGKQVIIEKPKPAVSIKK
ncbi:MAG: MucR family transcriptional regulator, partial [Gammaproteobacteria bacterium]|nr:MucR family transcriptional regulator [Gammaproteobacteria bacterium]